MAPNGKPASYVMQQQRSPLQSINEQVAPKESNIQVKSECILFSQSVMSGRWNMPGNTHQAEQGATSQEGPEPRVLSKKRRDLINAEIRELQNLLPLKKSARERLSYLGILALTNTFIRKATFFKKESVSSDSTVSCNLVPDFASSLYGFLLVFNREGKILFTSDNILDYLGNTVVELASQGDSIYDLVDKEDHDQIRAHLDVPPHDDRGDGRKLSFFCRMSTSRYMKTQMRSWKNKIVHVSGRYYKPSMSNDWSDTVFFAVCTPIESKPVTDVRHHPSPRVVEFKAVHGPDMQFLEVSNKVEDLLGYKREELENTSWYHLIYPEDLEQARQQHLKFVKEDGSSLSCVLRMIKKDGSTAWVDITAEKSQESVGNSFVCSYILIDEEEVPYFRIHHNLLPFPEHYTDAQRQYLAYRSTLLSAALHSEVASATSAMTSASCLGHTDSAHFSFAQQMFGSDMDTKTILRRQLMKRKLTSGEGPLCAGTVPYAPEIYGVPPNKMLIRSTSELPYPSPGAYHIPLQHSSSFPDGSLHPLIYRGISSEESYLAQFHNTANATHGYLFDGGYAPLTSSSKHSFSFHPSQRSPAMHSNEPVSPINGHVTQHNQNNNARKATLHHEDPYHNQHYSTRLDKSPRQESIYYQPNASPGHVMPSPGSPSQQPSPIQHSMHHPTNAYNEQECVQSNTVVMRGNAAASPIHGSLQQQSSVSSSYGSPQTTISYQPTAKHSPQPNVSVRSCVNVTSSPTYVNHCEWNEPSYPQEPIQPANLSTHQLKEEALGSPQCGILNSQCASPSQPMAHPSSPYNQACGSPNRNSPNAYPTSSCSQMGPDGFGSQMTEKSYQVQYSISSGHAPAMQQCQAAALYAVHQSGVADNGMNWTKKYRNMPNMEMIFSEVDCSNRLA